MWSDLEKKKKLESKKCQQSQMEADDLKNSIPYFIV